MGGLGAIAFTYHCGILVEQHRGEIRIRSPERVLFVWIVDSAAQLDNGKRDGQLGVLGSSWVFLVRGGCSWFEVGDPGLVASLKYNRVTPTTIAYRRNRHFIRELTDSASSASSPPQAPVLVTATPQLPDVPWFTEHHKTTSRQTRLLVTSPSSSTSLRTPLASPTLLLILNSPFSRDHRHHGRGTTM